MTAHERAAAVWTALDFVAHGPAEHVAEIAEAITAAVVQARAAALEEAAQHLDAAAQAAERHDVAVNASGLRHLAAAIRSRATKEG